MGFAWRNPSPKGVRGRRTRAHVFIVDTDCKAGVKFDLVGHKATNGSEGQKPSINRFSFGMGTTTVRIAKYEGLVRPMPICSELTKGQVLKLLTKLNIREIK